MTKQVHSSLKVLMVSDIEVSKKFYRDALGCEVTDWWVIRDGLKGLGLKLLQAATGDDVRPNKPALGAHHSYDVYVYVNSWKDQEDLYKEFIRNGADIYIEPWVNEDGGPWREFAVKDPDGYVIAFGGTEQSE